MYDMWEDALEMQVGLIHTHHTMSAFFSGTDDSELHDNVAKHNYYLSLIVSQTSEYCAKVAALVDLNVTQALVKDENGKMSPISNLNIDMPKYMAVAECDIQIPETEEPEETPYLRWINELNEERKKKQKSKTYNYKGSNYTTYGSTYQGNNNQDYYGQGQLPLKSKNDSKEFKFNELPAHTKNSLFAKMIALDVQCKDTLPKVIGDINKSAKKNKDMSKKEYLESHAFAIFEYASTIAESFLGVPINFTGEGTLMYEFANELSKRKDSEGIVPEIIKQMEIPNER